jgi:disulfide oxidoreductase YuzD
MTSVEWLINELHKKQNGESSNLSYNHIFDKAKEIEKQQIIDAFEQGDYTGRGFEDLTSEEYYHINFKSK